MHRHMIVLHFQIHYIINEITTLRLHPWPGPRHPGFGTWLQLNPNVTDIIMTLIATLPEPSGWTATHPGGGDARTDTVPDHLHMISPSP